MANTLVLSMGDAGYKPLTDLTFPFAETYARSIGADFRVITRRTFPCVHMGYEKFQARDFLEQFERIVYLDGDVLVRSGTPNVFDIVPCGAFGAMDEIQHLGHWTRDTLARQLAPYSFRRPWRWGQFNSGVMVFDRTHKKVFENPVVTNVPLWDQPALNVAVRTLGVPFFGLPPEFNFMVFHEFADHEKLRERAFLLHFSGVPLELRLRELRRETGTEESATRPEIL